MRTCHERRDIDSAAGRELHGADTHNRRALGDRVEQGPREVFGRDVVDPSDAHARALARRQPRVGHAREVGSYQDHLTVRGGEHPGKLTETLAGAADDRDRTDRRTEQPGSSRSQSIENLGLGLIRQPEVAVLRDVGQEAHARLHRDAGDEAERRLVQVPTLGKRGVLAAVDQGGHVHPRRTRRPHSRGWVRWLRRLWRPAPRRRPAGSDVHRRDRPAEALERELADRLGVDDAPPPRHDLGASRICPAPAAELRREAVMTAVPTMP